MWAPHRDRQVPARRCSTPANAVYSDPAWQFAKPELGLDPALFAQFAAQISHDTVAALNPRWEEADIQVELETVAVWDSATAVSLSGQAAQAGLPEKAVLPSLVQVADPSLLISEQDMATLRERGFEVRTVPGAGHTIHRDDFDGFIHSLEGWI